ncbi:MAG: ComF family protein [Bacteroidia bacterium]|nr:ComF family protein [Bacteroidia bacterium]
MTKSQILSNILNSLYPNLCPGCNAVLPNTEMVICGHCELNLPVTDYHQLSENPVAKLFWGKIDFVNATSFLKFNKKGIVQGMMHQLKYHGNKRIGEFLGYKFGEVLHNSSFMEGINGIIPLPLHPRKLVLRGYNQSEYIAIGMSKSLNIPLLNHFVERAVNNISQTKIAGVDRHQNVQNIFALRPNHTIGNQHLLIVDDTITTGATLESLGRLITTQTNCRVSFATIASVV